MDKVQKKEIYKIRSNRIKKCAFRCADCKKVFKTLIDHGCPNKKIESIVYNTNKYDFDSNGILKVYKMHFEEDPYIYDSGECYLEKI